MARVINSLQFLAVLLSLFFFNRIFFIAYFVSPSMDDLKVGFEDYSLVLFQGFRFDLIWAAALGFSMAFLKDYFRILIFFLSIGICLVSNLFYLEYQDNFNEIIFNLYRDDFWAILVTSIKEYYLIQILVLGLGLAVFFNKIVSKFPRLKASKINFILSLIILGISIRGGIGKRPMQLKDASVTMHRVLNKAVLNPLSALRYAFKEHHYLNQGEHGIEQWLNNKANLEGEYQEALKTMDLNPKLLRVSKNLGPKLINKPDHIFLVVMESQDFWPLLPQYQDFNLAPGLKELSGKGLTMDSFVSSSIGTMGALNAIITGLGDSRLNTNYQKSAQKPYATSLPRPFHALGYQVNLFYGGYLSWQSLEDFALNQGFDRVYGAAHMGNWSQTNEWGVHDQALFNFIETSINKTQIKPSFNLIMTVSNHPPYSVDLKQAGFDLEKAENLLKQKYPHSNMQAKHLGHYWYADKMLKNFVDRMALKYPNSLFIITADHFSRKHVLNEKAEPYETSAIPLIFYGKNLNLTWQKYLEKKAGSHIDIIPSILNLISPPDFKYQALGKNLFEPENLKNSKHQFGLGYNRLMLPNQKLGELENKNYLEYHRQYHLISSHKILYPD
ncbi:MAG: LTA synthase family protein [Gammaproteobacteria bacterium]